MGYVNSGRGFQAVPAIAAFDQNSDGIVSDAERRSALIPWLNSYKETEQKWCHTWQETYKLSADRKCTPNQHWNKSVANVVRNPKHAAENNLVQAVLRQHRFQKRI